MDIVEDPCTMGRDSPEPLPSLIKYISAKGLADFGSIEGSDGFTHQLSGPKVFSISARESGEAAAYGWKLPISPVDTRKVHSVSISMPPSPTGHNLQTAKSVLLCGHDLNLLSKNVHGISDRPETAEKCDQKFYSQPMPKGAVYLQATNRVNCSQPPHSQPGRDARFNSFKTWSGRLERQLSILRGIPVQPEIEPQRSHRIENDTLPVDRYFDALEGPELDKLRPLEQSVLPDDTDWPFLLRYTISSFGICLGVSSQAILWKTLATSASTKFLHISLKVNLILWIISLALIVIVSSIYILKLVFYFEAVRREFYHPIRVNFFFAPWIALLFLCLGVPPSIAQNLHHALWYVLMTPIFCLELKIYGQWMSGSQRRLSKVANPSNHLSIVGNFVGTLLGATMGLKEGPLFFFAVGLAHYAVLFVTLYQRLPTNETLPKELHPVFFLFVAAPSVASMAWAKLQGSFDYGSRLIYFVALFLYFSLAARVNFFRGFRYSLHQLSAVLKCLDFDIFHSFNAARIQVYSGGRRLVSWTFTLLSFSSICYFWSIESILSTSSEKECVHPGPKTLLNRGMYQVVVFIASMFASSCGRFSLAWWAYTFPMTGAAIATIRYSNEVGSLCSQILAVTLCAVSTLMVTTLLVTTMIHAFVLRDLFPKDSAIAISDKPPITRRKWFPVGNDSSGANDIMRYLKLFGSDGKEVEVAVNRDGKIMGAPCDPRDGSDGDC